ncbi:MAG: 50S ribosomal protein L29 [candidate division KSB1 bacterium]|nr:50S ribosomal protein L29 [candidate division KSB1 bacterium]MDZ7294366.1 50S ribosomal protein L29 [candidate division KSB1 bacterium]MDZ7338210.1 50S ribosomal protein L29 [candidate division KSB1 bacterium]MDZ7384548.1 50S ribosomal protein L29 [candidate division KSB1 bacterium]MDZ7392845.1 50S ribosomal protein L29 [candidate division KSB1 bacterium]
MKMEEIKQLPVEELKLRLEEAVEELHNLRFQHATHQLDNPLKIRFLRKDIARLKTVLREYELGIRKPKS